MRLLETRKLELMDIRDDAVPLYAILSHTWGSEEITLQELRHMKGRMPQTLDKRKRAIADKEGFAKVKDAAALASKRGYSFIWIDTCCIDKTSSAELSEAINSMYLWYQQSAECYALLSDVKPVKDEPWALQNSTLMRSRWFTRGWTLQELIAPKVVRFYARDWTLLGCKDGPVGFTQAISTVTGIDMEVLDGRIDPLQLSVSARMKWASHRLTTRLEDMAYSLMGLFQVNMPLLYGEGHRAFARLQEEIIQRTDDQSIYAWNSFDTAEEDPDVLSGLLAHSPAQFKDAGDIQPLPPSPVYASAPSGMTNHGLRVQLYLRPILEGDGVPMEEDYWAILDCFVREGDTYLCPVIRLRRLSEDQYGRLQTKSQKRLPPLQSGFTPEYEGYRTIYIRQQPVYYHLPQFRISPLHVHPKVDESQARVRDFEHYRLTDVYPAREWNSTTMTMKVKYSRTLQAMGLFRFQSPVSDKDNVDIVVGLRRLDAMQWEGWCFQRASTAESLESTLSVINQKISDLTKAKKAAISAAVLRQDLGDDSRLKSDATVEGIQLQGRLYISIAMTFKPEIQTGRELSFNQIPAVDKIGFIQVPLVREFQIRAITTPYSVPDPLLLDDAPATIPPTAVRGPLLHTTNPIQSLGERVMLPLQRFRNKSDLEGKSPETDIELSEALMLASYEGDTVKIQDLLDQGADINGCSTDPYGLTPLHWSIVSPSTAATRFLLEKGVSPTSRAKNGWSAIHVAAIFNRRVWRMLSAKCESDDQRMELASSRTENELDSALHIAASYASDSEFGRSFFWDLVWALTEYSSLFSQNKFNETPLHRAAAFDNVGAIQCICEEDNTTYKNVDRADLYGRTPLWHAAATGSVSAIKKLVELGAMVNLSDDMGRSPLHAASRGGHAEAVKELLDRGAVLSSETSFLGLTARDLAAMFGHDRCLDLLSHPVRSSQSFGSRAGQPTSGALNRALHIAASCGWYNCVTLLCRKGANPFVPQESYLKLDETKSFAVQVHQEIDACNVAIKEGNVRIANYFADSADCHAARSRKAGLSGRPTWSRRHGPESRPPSPAPSRHSDNAVQDPGWQGQEVPLQAHPATGQPKSGPEDLGQPRIPFEPEVGHAAPPRLPSVETTTSGGRASTQVATLPAYSSPAYSLPYNTPGYSQQYASPPSQGRWASAPNSMPTPYRVSHPNYQGWLPQAPRPSFASALQPHQLATSHAHFQPLLVPTAQTVQANLVSMLGALGHARLLEPPPETDASLLAFDEFTGAMTYTDANWGWQELEGDLLDAPGIADGGIASGVPVQTVQTAPEQVQNLELFSRTHPSSWDRY